MKVQEIIDKQILLVGENSYKDENVIFLGVSNKEDCRRTVQGERPFYSSITVNEDTIICEVDLVRSSPIFYSTHDGKLLVSNIVQKIIDTVSIENLTFSDHARISFLHSGYTTGDSTLYEEIKQIKPGRKITFDHSGRVLESTNRFKYEHQYEELVLSQEEYKSDLHQTLISVFSRMMQNVGDRQVVLPLSGGKDSRVIALILKVLSVKNVLCFTYGDIDTKDTKISKQVAEQLGFDWEFVPYSVDEWNTLYNSKEREYFFKYCFNHNTLPHIQDWLAIKKLKEQSKIEPEAFVVPGHSADLPAGSFSIKYPKVYEAPYEIDRASETLQSVLYSLNNPSPNEREALIRMIKAELNSSYFDLSDAFDSFFIQEKISKFIVNSMRTYEFYGFNWWLPFWDPEFWNFWRRVPKTLVLDQKLYKYYLDDLERKFDITVDDTRKETKRWYKPAVVKKMAKELANVTGLKDQYYKHPMKWYGIMEKEYFAKNYKGNMHINSFLAKILLEDNHN